MIKTLTYVAPHKTALTISLVFAVGSLFFVIPMSVMFMLMPQPTGPNGEPVPVNFPYQLFFIMPVFYFIFGYLFTAFNSWLYNKISKLTGGIKFEFNE